jgi:hypothetical protein
MRPSRPTNAAGAAAANQQAYIPPQIQQAMTKNMQQNLPAHLRQYVDSNNSGYIPSSIQASITKEMNKSMPAYMQQYTGAYIEQNMVNPSVNRQPISTSSSERSTPPPIPDQLRRSHSIPVGEQKTVGLDTLPLAAKANLFAADTSPYTSTPPPIPGQQPLQPAQPTKPTAPYDFIMNPQSGPKQVSPFNLGGGRSSWKRLLAIIIGALILIILIAALGSALGGKSNAISLVSVAQDETEILHILGNAAGQEQSLNQTDVNFIATSTAVIQSSDTQLLNYMAINKVKYKSDALTLKESPATDTTLSNSIQSGNYESAFYTAMQTQLKTYVNDLSIAYKMTKGTKGRALLQSDDKQAVLLYKQITTNSQ